MIRPVLFLLLVSATLFGCKKDPAPDELQTDTLEATGILGNWEIQDRTTGNISDMLPLCCEFIEFKVDDNADDLKGDFESRSNGETTNGTFEIDPDNATIFFEYNQKQRLDEYTINNERLSLRYDENGITIEETYIRRD